MLDRNSNGPIPDVRTELPGPAARELIADDHRWTSPSYTRVYPLAVRRGEGAVIEDVDGNRFLDFTAGLAVCATGHCHPRVVRAIQEQSEQLIHMSGTDFYYGPLRDLSRKLAEIAPGDSAKRVFLTNSGAEAVEAALKVARHHTGRPQAIAFLGGFHGRTMGALSLTGSKTVQRRGFGPFVPGITHVPFPSLHTPLPMGEGPGMRGAPNANPIEAIEELFRRTVPPDEVAAFIVEPIQGEGGYVVPPPEFHRELKTLAERHGILYIADEVQSGMGRTGRMFAVEHFGVVPDVICVAKGIASGMPLGAMIAPAEIMNWPSGAHASTFGGNPVCCAAALETIALLEEGLIDHAAETGEFLLARLRELQGKHALIGDVRGKGLMIGIELVRDRSPSSPAPVKPPMASAAFHEGSAVSAAAERDALVQACFRRGLLILGAGENTIRLSPPLVITQAQSETALRILNEALTEVGVRRSGRN